MKLDMGIEHTETSTTKCGLKIFCAKTKTTPTVWWRKIGELLVSPIQNLSNLPNDLQNESFFELTLTYDPKKIYHDGFRSRLEKMITYIKYLNKNKFKYFFYPEYHSSGACAGEIHWHGILYKRDYVATNRAVAYWTRNNGRASYVKKDFSATGELSYETWVTYCTKDTDKMNYNETPIVSNLPDLTVSGPVNERAESVALALTEQLEC